MTTVLWLLHPRHPIQGEMQARQGSALVSWLVSKDVTLLQPETQNRRKGDNNDPKGTYKATLPSQPNSCTHARSFKVTSKPQRECARSPGTFACHLVPGSSFYSVQLHPNLNLPDFLTTNNRTLPRTPKIHLDLHRPA